MKRIIEVVDYDCNWPTLFEEEAIKLVQVFNDSIVGIHHIGSTAVPGSAAKPTIDILIELKDGSDISQYYQDMQQLGYESRGECLDAIIPGTPGRHYFPKIVNTQHIIHVHVCHESHFQIEELLNLRDYLRSHSKEAAEYGTHKTKLAAKYTSNNVAYMERKDFLVKALIEKAMKWKAQSQLNSAYPKGRADD